MFKNINETAYINGQQGIYDNRIKNPSVRYARNAVDNFKDAYSQERIEKYHNLTQEAFMNMNECNGRVKTLYDKLQQYKDISNLDKDKFESKLKIMDEYIVALSEYAQAKGEYANAIRAFVDNTPGARFNMKYAQNESGKPDTMAVLGAAYEELDKRTSVSVDELTNTLRKGISDKNKHAFSADSLDINNDGKIDIGEYGASLIVEDMLSTNPNELNIKNITGEINTEGQNRLLSFAAIHNYEQALNTYKAIHSDFKLDEAKDEFLKDKNNQIR